MYGEPGYSSAVFITFLKLNCWAKQLFTYAHRHTHTSLKLVKLKFSSFCLFDFTEKTTTEEWNTMSSCNSGRTDERRGHFDRALQPHTQQLLVVKDCYVANHSHLDKWKKIKCGIRKGKGKEQGLIWLDNKQLNCHIETVLGQSLFVWQQV